MDGWLLTVGLAAAIGGWAGSIPAWAGGGPENLLLVVNTNSWASQTVANHYIHLRQIPTDNVCYLDWNGGVGRTDVANFRREILAPAQRHIAQRGLDGQIDYIVYSSDFPTGVEVDSYVRGMNLPSQLTPSASINSATYFWQAVVNHSPLVVGLENNHYMRPDRAGGPVAAAHGFRAWYGWGSEGELLEAGGQQYLLSTMLAVTSGRGNSVAEAIRYLDRSAKADGTHPAGTIYYMKNSDVRSTVRDAGFGAAAAELKALGIGAVVDSGVIPIRRRDVQGLMTGTREFDWRRSGSTILPGALCEHFTSYGGVMTERSSQTPLSELLRFGAAGASGTVVEPFAIAQKFPSPRVQVYYASGCTLAEAFYQSISGPYQLLIVGDPLCRPWANIPVVKAGNLAPGATLSGTVEIRPSAQFTDQSQKLPGGDPSRRTAQFELFVDGVRTAWARPNESLVFDTRRVADGFHELRIVAIAAGAIETQGRVFVPVQVDNHGRAIELAVSIGTKEAPVETSKSAEHEPSPKPAPPNRSAHWGQALVLTAQAADADEIIFFCNGRGLGRAEGTEGRLVIDPRRLGSGPVQIQALGRTAGQGAMNVVSRPIQLMIEANPPLPAWQTPRGARLVRGMLVRLADGQTVPVHETFNPTWLSEAGVKTGESWQLGSVFDVADTDTYQFQLAHDGDLKLHVDGHVLYDGTKGDERERFVPVALAKGLHRLNLAGVAGANVRLRIAFGGEGTLSIGGPPFRHISP